MEVTCFADEIQEQFDADCEQAEVLLRDIALQNRKLTTAEVAFFARLGWDEWKAREQRRRVHAVMTLVPICGTPEQRQATQEEAKIAAAVYAKEVPKIDEQIAKLQAKRDAFERDKNLIAKRAEQQNDAVVKLRGLVPIHIRKRVNAAETKLNTEGVGADLRAAKQRHHELVCILNIGNVYPNSADHVRFGLSQLLPAAMIRNTLAYSQEWPALKAECEREFAELNKQLPGLQREFDAALAIVEAPLGYYADPKNWEND